MELKPQDYTPFSADAQRTIANLEQAYGGWVVTQRELAVLPNSMYWATKGEHEYLTAKLSGKDNGTALGPRSAATEAQFAEYTEARKALSARRAQQEEVLTNRIALYRTRLFRLPLMTDEAATILRKLDVEELLGSDVMVVGTNAFGAYELACGALFPTGNEFTKDFDLAWCRDTTAVLTLNASIAATQPRKSLFAVLRDLDGSYRINPKKTYQAINSANYEVELLAAPSTHPLPKAESFSPMNGLFEQEALLLGRPIYCVMATPRSKVCPVIAPDPRFMALHKLWLADKPERKASKKDKDRRQGNVLLDAVRYFLESSHPLDIDFVLELPSELRPIFDAWCADRNFEPES